MLTPSIAVLLLTQSFLGQFLNSMPAPLGATLIKERRVAFKDLAPNYVAFNPSMVRYHGQTIMVFRRDLKPGAVAIETQLALVPLDADFQPTQPHQVLDTRMPGAAHHTAEDPRLFVYGDELFVLFNQTPDGRPDGLRKIYLAKIDIFQDSVDGYTFRLAGYSHLEVPLPNIAQRAEKNWVPMASEQAMHIAYNSNPPRVFRVAQNTLAYLTTHQEIMMIAEPYRPAGATDLWIYGEIRGGTPAIANSPNDFLACFHSGIESFLRNRYHRTYLMGCYLFDAKPPYAVKAVTEKPVLPPSFFAAEDVNLIIFPGGIFELGGILHVTYGINDAAVWVADIDKRRLLSSMTATPTLPLPLPYAATIAGTP